jgi:hypothetical protein
VILRSGQKLNVNLLLSTENQMASEPRAQTKEESDQKLKLNQTSATSTTSTSCATTGKPLSSVSTTKRERKKSILLGGNLIIKHSSKHTFAY